MCTDAQLFAWYGEGSYLNNTTSQHINLQKQYTTTAICDIKIYTHTRFQTNLIFKFTLLIFENVIIIKIKKSLTLYTQNKVIAF